MRAPTVVYGPDGSRVKPGEEIPADWFTAMPDLADHLRLHEDAQSPAEIHEDVTPAAVSLTGRGTRKRAGQS